MLLATKTPGAQYSGTVVVAMGLLPSVACHLAWIGGSIGGETKRAVALVVGCGNLGGASAGGLRSRDGVFSSAAASSVYRIIADFSAAFAELGDGSPLYRWP
uniref:Cytochrome P450 monooxygenase CYP52X1 n=1 Tax=Ganoderma boninense TaxID=34458 RepID=A0A5K1K733_9APHY|nr:Cytochrome P450 monooxygenase CYP52X1 [Ganoderma boninense]